MGVECYSVATLVDECTQHNLRDKGRHGDADSEPRGTNSVRRPDPGRAASGGATELCGGAKGRRTRVPMDSFQDQ